MAPEPFASAFPLHSHARLLDEHDRVLFQHSHPAGADSERATLKERPEGFSESILEEIQRGSHSVYLDQRARALPTHHRGDEGVPSCSSQTTKATKSQINNIKD